MLKVLNRPGRNIKIYYDQTMKSAWNLIITFPVIFQFCYVFQKKKKQNRKKNCDNDESKPSINNNKEKSLQHNRFPKQNKNTKLKETLSIGQSTDCLSENVPQSNIGRFVRLNPSNHSESKKSKVKSNLKSAKKQQKNSNQNMKSNTRESEKLENKELIEKRPLVSNINKSEKDLIESFKQSLDTDKLDEVIINAKKRKLNSRKEEKDVEEKFYQSSQPLSKKKKLLKNLLLKASHRNAIQVNGNSLRERMLQKLKGMLIVLILYLNLMSPAKYSIITNLEKISEISLII